MHLACKSDLQALLLPMERGFNQFVTPSAPSMIVQRLSTPNHENMKIKKNLEGKEMQNSSGAISSSNAKLKSGLSLFRCFRKSVRFTTALPLMKEDTPAHQKGEEAFIQNKAL